MSRLMYSLLGAAIGSGITYALLKGKKEEPDATRTHAAEFDDVELENTNEGKPSDGDSELFTSERLNQLSEQCDSLIEEATILMGSYEDMQKQCEENLALIDSLEMENAAKV